MSLSEEKLRKLILSSPQKGVLEEAQKHENRLALHTETEVRKNGANPAYNDFLNWVAGYLPKDKFERFCQLLKNPIATLGISNEIFTELSRVFDGQNSFFNYEFKSTDLEDDFNTYLKTVLEDRSFFKNKGFEQLKSGINSVLIVDLPREPTGERLEPVYYFINSSSVRHVKVNHKGGIDAIIFELKEDTYGVYNDESYRIYNDTDGTIQLVFESEHSLGYCPATFFWDKDMKKDNLILKKSPITDWLNQFDRYLAQDTFKEHADLYSSYPIVVSMAEKCDFENCQNGYIDESYDFYNNDLEEMQTRSRQIKCESCESRKLVGAGTNYMYTAPQTADSPDLSDPVKIISADIKPLEYLGEKLDHIASEIKSGVIGTSTKAINDQAINELQVMGSFESRRNVLINLKESFEKVHKFANDTVALLRYGDSFVGSTVNYGDEFYLKNVAVLQEEYKVAKENGEPDEEIDSIYRQIIQTKYRGNKDKIKRAWTLYNLNPMPHNTLDESKELASIFAVSEEDFIIKARFTNFIARFEREQTNIITFGENLEFKTRIDKIYSQLKKYANESKQVRPSQEQPT